MTSGLAQDRLKGLDSLRGLAAMAVVLFHFTSGYESIYGRAGSGFLAYLPKGCFGVQLFFCISGFVILRTLERTADIKMFAMARIARLYPAYFVCATISLATIAASHVHLTDLSAKAIAINATMLSGLTGTAAIDPSYWTLSYEVLFYASAALIWFRLRPKKRLELPCLVWLGSSLVGHLVGGIHLRHRLCTLINVDYANLFVLGMMLYYLSQRVRSRLTIPTFLAGLSMAVFPPGVNGVGVALSKVEYVFLIAAFCLLIWLVSDGQRNFLNARPLVFLGEISYSLYLVHQVVGFAAMRALLKAGTEANVALLATIALVIGLATCLRVLIEKPAERWIKNFAKPANRVPEVLWSASASGGR